VLPGCPYSCILSDHWPPVPRERFSPWAESAPTRIVSGRTGVRVKAVIPFGVGEAFVHRVHILGAELAQAHAGGGVGCLAMSGICYATADETNKSG